jgi:nitrogen fixation NifU-like protein
MSDLRELYQSVILDHNRQPRNLRRPEQTNRSAEGFNPLCGDKVTVHLELADGVVRDVGFEGSGCAISTASASLMTESVKGMKRADVDALFERFHRLVTGPSAQAPPAAELDALGKLAVFAGVREYPVRVKCATLVWHALRAALEGGGRSVTTE